MNKSWLRLGAVALAAAFSLPAFLTPAAAAVLPLAWQEGEAEKSGEEPAQEPQTPEEKLAAWQQDYQEQMTKFSQAARAAKTPEERAEVMKLQPRPMEFVDKFMELAQENPKTPIAAKALVWVAMNGRGTPASAEATKRLLEDHPDSLEIGTVVQMLGMGMPDPGNETLLRKVIETSPHAEVQAKATFSLANLLKQMIDFKGRMDADPQMAEAMSRSLPKPSLEYLQAIGTEANPLDKLNGRIEELYQKIVDEYPDVKLGNRTLGKVAEGALFEMRYLSIGKIAPDIEGKDFDEVAFKLSDYRGKIVVLDFWGDW
jgi:hypothetical protein